MGQSFGTGFPLVEVTTDELVRGEPVTQLWVVAAQPEQAVTLVLAEVPVGWTAVPLDMQLSGADEVARLRMQPGEARKLR